MYFKLRNDANMTNRVQVRNNMENPNIMIENFIGGKVVPGETKKVKIVINTKDMLGKYSDTVEVQTKSFIYKIPIKALIVKEEEFSLDRPNRLRKSYLWSKKIRISIYKIITYIPKIISGNYKRKSR